MFVPKIENIDFVSIETFSNLLKIGSILENILWAGVLQTPAALSLYA